MVPKVRAERELDCATAQERGLAIPLGTRNLFDSGVEVQKGTKLTRRTK